MIICLLFPLICTLFVPWLFEVQIFVPRFIKIGNTVFMPFKVTLRQRPISKGRQSLYLDFYPAIIDPETKKETRREYLGLYLFDNPKTPIDKRSNKETQILAENIRQNRHNELNKPEIYTEIEREQLKANQLGQKDFVEYFTKLAHKRKNSNHDNWMSALNYIVDFTKGQLKFVDLDQEFCEDFKNYLLTAKTRRSEKAKLAQNSAVSYFNKFKASLKQAFKDGYLKHDLNSQIEGIKQAEPNRDFLTMEELNRLVKTPCNNPIMKKAALFSALTGLRFSDIQKLEWKNIEYNDGQPYLRFEQQKTKGIERTPFWKKAANILGEQGESKKIFEGLKYSAYHNKHLFQWIGAAGITKDITFHCFRHTYAVLQLANGTDIYTVSKMLGHRDLKTTQIYAKVIDRSKKEATNKIILDIDEK